jgi:hypothetical protein
MSIGDVVILHEEVAPKGQVARPQERPAQGALHRAEPAPVQKFLAGLTRYDDCGGTRHRGGERRSCGQRAIMVDRTICDGSASDLLRLCAERTRDDISRGTAWAKIRGRSPVDCGGRRRSCGLWASRSRSLVKAGRHQNDQREHMHVCRKIPSAPSASSVLAAVMLLGRSGHSS